MNFSQRSVTLEYQFKASPMPRMRLASTNKMPMSCLLLRLSGGGDQEGCTCFASFSLSLPFPLYLGCLIFTLNDGLIIFYVSFFF